MDPVATTAIKKAMERLRGCVPQSVHPQLGQAYHLAFASHEEQSRDAGLPYITHPIEVAVILASELGFSRDVEMVVAALLHDAVEDSELSLDEVAPTFGPSITTLVRGVTKVEDNVKRSRPARRTATLQRLFSAAREDPRVLILKLADRVHNMRTIDGIRDPERQERIAQETIDVYTPLSHLLGMGRIRRDLENRCFRCLEPEAYADLAHELESGPPETFRHFVGAVRKELQHDGIRARTRLQTKSLFSVHRKTLRANTTVASIDDRYAVEVIVSSRDACYRTLGVVHKHFQPVMERIKDFIASPKRNGYQALHTTVIDRNVRFEVHIQTPSMNRMGELGVATLKGSELREERRRRWLQELAEWHDPDAPTRQLLSELKRILFVREIAAFTPKGDPIILPEGASLLDFAFAVHTDLGMRCSGGLINGRSATPFSVLNWGDRVEIRTSESQYPQQSWLRYAKTYRAQRLIRYHLNRAKTSGGLMFT